MSYGFNKKYGVIRKLNPDRKYISKEGLNLKLKGRSLILI